MLHRYDRVLFGDNRKSAGLNVRIDRIEASAKVIFKISWGVFDGMLRLTCEPTPYVEDLTLTTINHK